MASAGALFVIAAGPESWWNPAVLASRPLVGIGLVSYPLYLLHWPALTYLRQVSVTPPTGSEIAGVVAVAGVLSWLVYCVAEQPIRRLRVGWRATAATTVLLALLGVVGAAGAFVWQEGEALPPRFSARLQTVVSFSFDAEMGYRQGRCYLMTDVRDATLADECVEPEPMSRPLVALWGDSHAAHLVPGLRRLQARRRFRLAQWNGARCPPVPGRNDYRSAVMRGVESCGAGGNCATTSRGCGAVRGVAPVRNDATGRDDRHSQAAGRPPHRGGGPIAELEQQSTQDPVQHAAPTPSIADAGLRAQRPRRVQPRVGP